MVAKLLDKANPLLHRPLKKVNKIDSTIKKLLQDMQDTLVYTGGVGIAANQIGADVSVFLVDPEIEKRALKLNRPRKFAAYFNPGIKDYSKPKAFMEEGCLSLPGYRGEVERSKEVTLEYMDFDGKRKTLPAKGLLAHIFQHETDHLNGKLYVDHITDNKKLYKITPLKIVFFGSSEFSVPVLERLLSLKYSWEYYVVGVVTLPDRPSNRGLVEKPTHVAALAEEHTLPLFKPNKLFDPIFIEKLKKLEPDLIILASYRKIIPKEILSIPKYGNLNIHPSMLPLYRGPSPIQSALLTGSTETGITIMKMNEKMDEGDIIAQLPFKGLPEENFQTLREKMSYQAGAFLAQVLPSYIDGRVEPVKQTELVKKLIKSEKIKDELDLYTKTFSKNDGFVDLANLPDKEKLNNMIRALYPWPGVWTRYQGKIVKILPGEKVQMEGKKEVSLKDFRNGHKDFKLEL